MNWKVIYEKYMFVVGIGGSLAVYLQALKIFQEESAGDLSLPANVIILISLISWLIYGLIRNDRVLVVVNIISTIGSIIILTGIALYS